MTRVSVIAWRVGVGLLVAAFLVLWLARFRIATAIVDRKLAGAQVPASYRVTRIGPFFERMENVRIGDPAHPDLVAKRIDVTIGYGLGGPSVTGIAVDGVALRAGLDGKGLHLGALDRLLPASTGGQTRLPDLALRARDVRLDLATPNGALRATLAGEGNPQRRFEGQVAVEAPALRLASCTLLGTRAQLAVVVSGGKPAVEGPISVASSRCPKLTLGTGQMRAKASSDATLDRVALSATLSGFGGAAGPVRFVAIHGPVEAGGTFGRLRIHASLGADRLALPGIVRPIVVPSSLPVAAPVRSASAALAVLLSGAEAKATVDADVIGETIAVQVRALSLERGEAVLRVTEQGGIAWSPKGWRADGDVTLRGGGLPAIAVQVRQASAGAPLVATGQMAPYRVAEASLAVPAMRVAWDGRAARFEGVTLVDGPLGDGAVRGLRVPLTGSASADGAFVVGQGCQPIAFASLRQAGFTFDAARVPVCGQPIVARTRTGIRLDASAGPVRLVGRSASGVPVTLAAARVHLGSQAIEARDVEATLGDSHLRIATLDRDRYSGASGAIANVPLAVSDGQGTWRFAEGALTLVGAMRVSDAGPGPRFLPLAAEDFRLSLKSGAIHASALLREPTSRAEIATVAIDHTLANGAGHAILTVPGITFAPKKLQPEALTRLTLGVVANVAGTVSGEGRIDWSATGVTSSGSFGSDRLDLAAAFGPVAGIKARIAFTDLLGLVSAPHQEATIAEINPGVAVGNGTVRFQLLGSDRLRVEDAQWPFAGGTLTLEPTTLDFGADAERHLTFRVDGLDAAAFVQQLDFPNLAATGRFDGVLPMVFDHSGGRIDGGTLTARRGGGTLAYVGELSSADLGTMGKLAFDALKAIRYSALQIRFDGKLDGEMISQVNFTGVREATPEQSLVTRLIRNLPFRFNIRIQAPFRGLVGSARAYMDPRLYLNQMPASQQEQNKNKP